MSTAGPRLFALTCGWLTGPLGLFLRGESGSLRVPVPAYLIEHPRGRVLFDSGLHPGVHADPPAHLGVSAGVFTCELEPDEDLAGRLRALGVDPDSVDLLVNSHLHFDHAGGNALLANARLVVQRAEWEAGRDPEAIQANGYVPADYDLGHDRLLVEGEHDLFGDGSVVCLPTPGHTPGHQSLRVRLAGGDVVLAGDACYLRRTLENGHLPVVMRDEGLMRESLELLRKLQGAGARIFYGHDPEFWRSVPQAPQPVV